MSLREANFPLGPVYHDYKFEIVYYVTPFGGKHREVLKSRLLQGMPPIVAVQGLPVSFNTARRLASHLGIGRKDYNHIHVPVGKMMINAYDIVDWYLSQNMTIAEIAKKARSKEATIRRVLDRMGVKNRWEYRKNNRTERQKQNKGFISEWNKINRALPYSLKCKRWKRKHYDRLLAIYNDHMAGMKQMDICKKHHTTPHYLKKHFVYGQKWGFFLDYGTKLKRIFYVSNARWSVWERKAQKHGNNVLDWCFDVLNKASSEENISHARD